MLWALVILGLVVAMGTILVGFIISRRASQSFIERRLGIAEPEKAAQASEVFDSGKSALTDALNRALASRGIGAQLSTQLARANLKFTVGEFIALDIILVIGFAAIAFLLRGADIIVIVIACLAGFFGPWIYVTLSRNRRLRAFNDQLSDTLNLMVNSIRAGYSILQAMEAVSEEMGPPISVEFGRVVREVQLGLTVEQALDNMLRRITSDDLDMMATAIKVQREVGGNLAEVLDAISYTIRERIRIKGEIRALTSYGRGAGQLLTAVPIILSVIIYLISPDFMSQLFEDRCGWIMIGVAILGIVLGYIVINKIVNIEV
jgi:tight adherence protein B